MNFIQCFDGNKNPILLNLSRACSITPFVDENETDPDLKTGIVVYWGSYDHVPAENEDANCDIFHGVKYHHVVELLRVSKQLFKTPL